MTARRAMTAARKWRIWLREGGRCRDCGEQVPHFGPGVIYDHANQLSLSGDDSDENIFAIHASCDKPKTAKDARDRGKVRRLRKKAPTKGVGTDLLAAAVISQEDQPPGPGARPCRRRIPSRPMGSPGLKRRFDGTVERRTP